MNQEKTETSLLQIRKVVREYILPRQQLFSPAKRFRALDGVSLTVNSGESFGIVGESGCGKSTLARTVMALEAPQSGEICFQGEILHSLKAEDLRRVRRGLQMIFQDPYGSLDPRQSVGKIVAEPLSLLGKMTDKKRSEKVAEALDNVGLSPNDAVKFPHEFSGGQRQRIAIARALITRPALIVADEPVSALDVSIQAQIVNLLQELQREFDLSLIFISHDLSIVRHICHRIMVLYLGNVMELADRDSIYAAPKHPYTKALLSVFPSIRGEKRPLTTLGGEPPNLVDPPTGCRFHPRCPYATAICQQEEPPIVVRDGHWAACWNPVG